MTEIGIFAIDPGGATGIAWAVLDKDLPVRDALRQRNPQMSGSDTIKGPELPQIEEIAWRITKFRSECVATLGILPENAQVVIEDFILRPGQHGGGKEGLSPIRIGWGIHGHRMGRAFEYELHGIGPSAPVRTIWQSPSDALSYATKERLVDWNCWIRGREHERSAWSHLAFRLNKIRSL